MRAPTATAPVAGGPPRAQGAEDGPPVAWGHPALGRVLWVQRRLRWTDRRHPWLLDSLIVLIVAAGSLPAALAKDDRGPLGMHIDRAAELPLGVLLALSLGLALPLWWRRRAPAVAFTIVALGAMIPWSLGMWLLAGASLLTALHNLALHGSLRVLGWAAAAIFGELSMVVWFLQPTDRPVVGLVMLAGWETAAIALGLTFRTQRVYLAALEDRAARLEIERDQQERLTAAAERSRVAREMHDIVGHNLSVMVGLADGGATLAASRGERAAEALNIIGETGRQAMGELRRVLGVLGDEPEGVRLHPQPGVADLDTLLARVRAAGVSVSYRTAGDLAALGSGIQLTIYRIVQEALTNTLKHAGIGSAAHVSLTAENAEIRVRVTDTGPPPDTGTPPEPRMETGGPGHGLVGVRQRTAMYGGTVTAGPRGDRPGWIVDVILEVPPASPPPTAGDAPGDHAS
ncbi:sensor histidine kinase [Actinoallomurus vinaceus]